MQARPASMNIDASIALAEDLIRQAARKGAKLIVFGETWLPGYPAWLDHSPHAALWNVAAMRIVRAACKRTAW